MKRSDLISIIKEIIVESGHVSACNSDATCYDFDPRSGNLLNQSGEIAFGGQTFANRQEAEQYLDDHDVYGRVLDLDEASSTGGPAGANAGYATPFGFAAGEDNRKMKSIASKSMPGGKLSDKTNETLLEARGRYFNLRESPMVKQDAKVSYLLREIKRMLKEVHLLVDYSKRLKTEEGITPKWKRSQLDIQEIGRQLKEIHRKITRI